MKLQTLTFCFLIFLVFISPVGCSVSAQDVEPAKPYAFVLAGQSNMRMNQDRLEIALKEVYGPDIAVIKTARDGSSINQWQRGETIYQNALSKTLQAQTDGYEVKALLFYQGEIDAKNSLDASRWKNLFIQFVYSFRADISTPGINVIFAQLGNYPSPASKWPYWETVRSRQSETLESKPAWRMITTIGLPFDPDSIPHYAEAQYEIITNRFISKTKALVPVP